MVKPTTFIEGVRESCEDQLEMEEALREVGFSVVTSQMIAYREFNVH